MKKVIGAVVALTVLSGCASITTTSLQSVSVEAHDREGKDVSGAVCELRNDKGKWFVRTPGSVSIATSSEDIQVLCEKPGYEEAQAMFASTAKSAMWGNVVFGGVIGAVVDHNSGAGYEYPQFLNVVMRPAAPGSAVSAAAAAPATPAATSRRPAALVPGDQWVYRQSHPKQPQTQREHIVRVKLASPEEVVDEVSVANGPWLEAKHSRGSYSVHQGVSYFSPYLHVFGMPASLSTVENRDRIACSTSYTCTYEAKFAGREKVTVPAGTFDALKVEYRHAWFLHFHGSGTRTVTVWYANDARRAVKVHSQTRSGAHIEIDTDYVLELTKYELK